MSRCFPYPPPGYQLPQGYLKRIHGECGEPVGSHIKFQKDLKKEEDKKKRKDKKEKKSSKKENKEVYSFVGKHGKSDNSTLKGKEEEAERSSLTEEHGQPVCPQSICYSSDSTRSSNKRKRDNFVNTEAAATKEFGSITTVNTKNNGNVIRIRLPLKRHKDPSSSSNAEQSCSTSGRNHHLPELRQVANVSRAEQRPGTIDSKVSELPLIVPITPALSVVDLERKDKSSQHSSKDKSSRHSSKDKSSRHSSKDKSSGHSSNAEEEKKIKKVEALYQVLFDNWVPPPMNYEQNGFDDQDWLFSTIRQVTLTGHIPKSSAVEEANLGGPAPIAPCARYLPHADIWALPYTIPF